MQGITIEELRTRHGRLVQDRKLNLDQLVECQKREHGFAYVLGELEQMIAELESRNAAENEAAAAAALVDLAALAEVAE
jgi:hypothetical protein